MFIDEMCVVEVVWMKDEFVGMIFYELCILFSVIIGFFDLF